MHFKSKKISLLILGILSIALSRGMFSLFDDPEGPNLLVVFGMAAILFFPSWAAYSYSPAAAGSRKLLLAIFIQAAMAVIFYLSLK